MNLRHIVSILFFFSFIVSAAAQDDDLVARGHVRGKQEESKPSIYTLPQFDGRWQEIKRLNAGKKEVAFNDTILLHFSDNNTVESRTTADSKMAIRMKGTATIGDDNTITTAAEVYDIISVTANEIVLKNEDDEITHYFKKSGIFSYELSGNAPVSHDEPRQANTLVNLSITNIMGNWSVYKRDAKPGAVTPTTVIIKALNITQKVNSTRAKGTATIYKGTVSEVKPCTVIIDGKYIKIDTENANFSFPVSVADGKEFDFGNKELMYYCKQL